MPHDFQRSCAVEERWAPVLDRWLGRWFRFRAATPAEQRRGIDRLIATPSGAVSIDYKCDERAAASGRIFLEVVSSDVSGRAGWLLTTEADWILYLVAPRRLLAFTTERLRASLPAWSRRFRVRVADNGKYRSLGLVVPIRVAEPVADYVAVLDAPAAAP